MASQKKILVLIIASDNHPAFLPLQEIWRSYMRVDPENIEAYFIKSDPNLASANELIGDTIFSKIEESYKPGILKKTILSMEFMVASGRKFDYVLRTNLSSFYVFPRLLEFVNTLPEKNCYSACPLLPANDIPAEFRQVPFGWGAGFILSRDLVELMVHHKEELFQRSSEIPDDVLIGHFFHKRNVAIMPCSCHTFLTYDAWLKNKDQIPKNAFHFRAKSHYVYRKLEDVYRDELAILSELKKNFYPTAISEKPASISCEIELRTRHEFHATYPSDINEHLPLLRELARQCSSVTEIGGRGMVSTWSILQGLSESLHPKRSYYGIGFECPSRENLVLAKALAEANGTSFQYINENDMKLDIEPVDMLFIDSLHTYAHLTYELEKFSPKVNMYIALHDTSEPWGDRDDTEYHGDYSEYPKEIDRTKKGLWPAVMDFLHSHPEWQLQERRLNNHGFTVLRRK
jgi:hypothetical protein